MAIDTGEKQIELDIPPAPSDQANFSSIKACPTGWRLASASELIYLYRINQFIPSTNRMGDYVYWVTDKNAAGERGYVTFPTAQLLYVNTGNQKGLWRCVRDM